MPRLQIKGRVPKAVVGLPQSRFEPRFVNGVHTVFDTRNFGHGQPLGTRKEADRVARELNEGKLQWSA